MQGGHKARCIGDGDAEGLQTSAHGRFVEQLRQAAGIDLASLTAAGAAVQSGRVRIVVGLAAMPHQQHQGRQVAIQTHGVQHAGSQCHFGIGVQAHQVGAAKGAVACGQAGVVVAHAGLAGRDQPLPQLAKVAHTGRFNEGKGGSWPAAGGLP